MRHRLRRIGLVCAAWQVLFGLANEANSTETVWDEIYRSAWAGIYTSDQAARGAAAYQSRCAGCHGASLEGSDDGPPLAGRDFTDDWDCGNMADLFEKIQFTMPANRPGQLSEDQIADVLSYILRMNRFPAGRRTLPTSADDLRGVVFFAANPLP